jgi:hypothetical protein
MRGQKKQTLTNRAPSATGRRKTSNFLADEYKNPTGSQLSTPSNPRPKPRPLVKKAAKRANTDVTEYENSEATAAHALIILQNRNHVTFDSPPITVDSLPINRDFNAAVNLPKRVNLKLPPILNLSSESDEEEDGEEEGEDEDELADDVDELEDDSDLSEFIRR